MQRRESWPRSHMQGRWRCWCRNLEEGFSTVVLVRGFEDNMHFILWWFWSTHASILPGFLVSVRCDFKDCELCTSNQCEFLLFRPKRGQHIARCTQFTTLKFPTLKCMGTAIEFGSDDLVIVLGGLIKRSFPFGALLDGGKIQLPSGFIPSLFS